MVHGKDKMAAAIIEQIAVKIYDALDGVSDPDETITLQSVRSKILNINDLRLVHGDVLIEYVGKETISNDLSSFRTENGVFRVTGFVSSIPSDSYADTYLIMVAETICKYLLEENDDTSPLGGLALSVDCPKYVLMDSEGGVDVIVDCIVEYSTNIYDGFSQD